jgi:hypothetical protein
MRIEGIDGLPLKLDVEKKKKKVKHLFQICLKTL